MFARGRWGEGYMRIRSYGAALVVAQCAVASTAFAQVDEPGNFSGERFELAVDPDGVLNVDAAVVPDHLAWDLSFWLGGAHDPLVLYDERAGFERQRGDLVGTRIGGSIGGAVSLFGVVQLGLSVPLVAFQSRNPQADGATAPLPALQVVGVGNVRLSPKVAVLRDASHGFDLAVIPRLSLPALSSGNYIGDDAFVFAPTVAASKDFTVLRTAFNTGLRFTETDEWLGLVRSHEITASAAVSVRLEELGGPPLDLDASLSGATSLSRPLASTQNYFEGIGGATYDFGGPLLAFAAAGLGTGAGYGTPDYRALVGVRLSSRVDDPDQDGIEGEDDACPKAAEDYDGFEDLDGCPEEDNDGDRIADALDGAPNHAEDIDGFEDTDGIPDPDNDQDSVEDARDACPTVAGVVDNGGCPDVDGDGDGVWDRLDACVAEPEDVDGFEDADGCPEADNDGDSVLDAADLCPDEAGPVANRGCPDVDTDGDGIVDRLDNCPKEAGAAENYGCVAKQMVRLTEEKIEIADKVYFEFGNSAIRSVSFAMLDNIAKVLMEHERISRLRIEGHTDDVGPRELNLSLSAARAKAVLDYLVAAGVSRERLESAGFAFDQPIADNGTEEGRAANRRVEFVIVEAPVGAEVVE